MYPTGRTDCRARQHRQSQGACRHPTRGRPWADRYRGCARPKARHHQSERHVSLLSIEFFLGKNAVQSVQRLNAEEAALRPQKKPKSRLGVRCLSAPDAARDEGAYIATM